MSKIEFPKEYFGNKRKKDIPSAKHLDKNLAKFKKNNILKFILNLPKNAEVLDAGCGSGKAIKTIMAYRPDIRISAIDISDVKDFIPDSVDFKRMSVEKIKDNFNENKFDAIICQHVLEHLLYPMDTMQGFKKVLKNNGRLYIEVPNWSWLLMPFSPSYFWNDYTHVRVYTVHVMKKLLNDYNFNILFVKTERSLEIISSSDSLSKINENIKKESFFKTIKKIFKSIFIRIFSYIPKRTLVAVAVNKKDA